MIRETIVDIISGPSADQRLVVALAPSSEATDSGAASPPAATYILQQESYSDDIGWFVQSRISVSSQQLQGLKVLLTGTVRNLLDAKSLGSNSHLASHQPANRPHTLRFDTTASVNVPRQVERAG